MKKFIAIVIALVMVAGIVALTACNSKTENKQGESSLKIVTTIFPEYDWVREVLGDKADSAQLTMLLDNGVDLHSYQPTVDDIAKISNCDVFIYVGGESDGWVGDALKNANNPNMKVINLLEVLGDKVKQEEMVEGMQEEEHEHEHEEIKEADIKDRSLSEFKGDWKSIYPNLINGDLDKYCEHKAEEKGETKEKIKDDLTAKWKCEASKISIIGNLISFTYSNGKVVSAEYKYAGYTAVKNDDGSIKGVRYQFETDSKDAPKYVQFNDHGHEPAEKVEHFHIYFGNESFDALTKSKTNPFFAPEALNAEEILEQLMHHSHEEKDEHVWLSLKNAQVLVSEIAKVLSESDSANAQSYLDNAVNYNKKLSELDAQYKAAADGAGTKTVLFGDRFPFRYMTDDYGLTYFAAFAGCSAETEASFETVSFLSKKVDELGLKSVLTIESSDKKIAQTVIDNTKSKSAQILTLDSMQSTTSKDVEGGTTYLKIMQSNLEVLKQALA